MNINSLVAIMLPDCQVYRIDAGQLDWNRDCRFGSEQEYFLELPN
jgi:hypothetical protein